VSVMGKRERDAARKSCAVLREHGSRRTPGSIEPALEAALDTADALAERANRLCEVWELASELDNLDCRRIEAAVKAMRTDLIAYDGPGDKRVTRRKLVMALKDGIRLVYGVPGCGAWIALSEALLARIKAEGGGK